MRPPRRPAPRSAPPSARGPVPAVALRSSRRTALPVAALVLVTAAAAAPAAHAERAQPLSGGPAGEVSAISADGTVFTIETGEGAPRLTSASLDRTGTVSAVRPFGVFGIGPPLVATGSDGSAAIASTGNDNSAFTLALRAPGGAFGAMVPVGSELTGTTSIATQAGVVLAGSGSPATTPTGSATQPVLLRRAADGTLAPQIALPGGPNQLGYGGDAKVALDAAGRGVVAWTRGAGAASRVNVATIAADGTVGPPTELPGRSPESLGDTRVAVRLAADGTGAVAWPTGQRTNVAPVSTTTGVDLARTTVAGLRGDVELQADGAALVTLTRASGGRRLLVTSRAPGKPFTPVRTVRGVRGGFASSALSGGRWVATQHDNGKGSASTSRASVVHGAAGGRPSKAVPVPVASGTNVDLTAAATGGRPLVLTSFSRDVVALRKADEASVGRIQVLRVAAGSPRAPRASVKLASSQRLGAGQALRVTVRCSVDCAYRVVSGVVDDGGRGTGFFDTARSMKAGTRSVRVPYSGSSASENGPERTLRRAQRVTLKIAVDDARGGERVIERTVRVRP